MAIEKIQVSKLTPINDGDDFEIPVKNKNTGKSGKASKAQLRGNVGPKGDKGDKGDTGNIGATGSQGPKGDKGDTGAQGAQGVKGDKGDTGAQGVKGDKGDKGDTGSQGVKGDKGDKGDTGSQGIQGEKGEKGDKGDGLEIVAHFDTPEELRSTYPTGAAGTFEIGESAPFDYYYWDMLSSEWRNSGQLQGPDGPPGQSGVYYGEDEPEGDVNVWIDPSGDADPNPGDGSGGYELTKTKVEEVLTGDIESHNHAAQVAEAIRLALVAVNNRINTLVGGSATSAIDTFHEIETFLQGITDVQTLTGMLNGLKEQIVALIPANAVQDAGYVHTDNNYTTGDKNKLAGIAANANNYSLPVASATVMGGVRIGEGLKIVDGVLTLDKIPWVGTQAQYNALPASQKTTDYICFITG